MISTTDQLLMRDATLAGPHSVDSNDLHGLALSIALTQAGWLRQRQCYLCAAGVLLGARKMPVDGSVSWHRLGISPRSLPKDRKDLTNIKQNCRGGIGERTRSCGIR
jgi:hypothetical protein